MQLNDVVYPLGRKKIEAMYGENLPLLTDELVEFEENPVEIQNFREFTSHFKGI